MNNHIILSENPEFEYTLVVRIDKNEKPIKNYAFVVTWKYDHTDNTWAQGHYFQTLESALIYMYFKDKCEDIYKVISEIKNVPFDLDY